MPPLPAARGCRTGAGHTVGRAGCAWKRGRRVRPRGEARGREGEHVPKEDVCQAIRDVADAVGSRPERLLMVDYQQRASDDDSLPGLSAVFAAYGSWKRARRAAAGAA